MLVFFQTYTNNGRAIAGMCINSPTLITSRVTQQKMNVAIVKLMIILSLILLIQFRKPFFLTKLKMSGSFFNLVNSNSRDQFKGTN